MLCMQHIWGYVKPTPTTPPTQKLLQKNTFGNFDPIWMKLGGDHTNHHSTLFRRGPQCFSDDLFSPFYSSYFSFSFSIFFLSFTLSSTSSSTLPLFLGLSHYFRFLTYGLLGSLGISCGLLWSTLYTVHSLGLKIICISKDVIFL